MTFTVPQKISDVERQLAELKARHGDIDVVVFGSNFSGKVDLRPVQLTLTEYQAGGAKCVKIGS